MFARAITTKLSLHVGMKHNTDIASVQLYVVLGQVNIYFYD